MNQVMDNGDDLQSPFLWNGGLNFTHSGTLFALRLVGNLSYGVIPQSQACVRFALRWCPPDSPLQGDPFDDSVLLWTRAVPLSPGPDQSIPVCVSFKIFDNSKLSGQPVDSGEAFTTYDVDFTVKVEAQHLKADTHYWFQFADCTNSNTTSPIGATRTISGPDSKTIRLFVQLSF